MLFIASLGRRGRCDHRRPSSAQVLVSTGPCATYGIGIAGILVITIDHCSTPTCCIEAQMNSWISLHKQYRTRC